MFNALKAVPEPEVEDFCCCLNLNSISPRLLYCDGVWFTVRSIRFRLVVLHIYVGL